RGGSRSDLSEKPVEAVEPSVERSEVVKLADDRIDDSGTAAQHADGISLAVKTLERPLEELSRRARARVCPGRGRSAKQARVRLDELRWQQVQPAGERLAAALRQNRITLFQCDSRDLVPVAGVDEQRDR